MYYRHFPPQPNHYRYAYPGRGPLSFIGLGILVCGAIALCSVLAPDLLELRLPGWRERFGYLVTLGVVLGLLRSVWRTMVPLLSVAFWIVALLCLWKPSLTSTLSDAIPTLSHAQPSTVQTSRSTRVVPASLTIPNRLGSALPDSAYFAKPYAPQSGITMPTSLSQAKSSLGRLFGGM